MTHDSQLQSFIEQLYMRYRSQLFALVHKYIHDAAAQEDVFHDVFICIIRKAELLYQLPQPKLEAYLCMIVRGVSIDYLRKTHSASLVDMDDSIILTLLERQQLQDGQALKEGHRSELVMMLENMPQEDQLLLWGKYYLELSTEELAHMIGCTQTATRSKIHRAKQKLFLQWQKSNLRWEDFTNG